MNINKKKLVKEYKQALQPMGVFQVKNKVNGKIFIGKAKDLKGIINSNKFRLKNGMHYIKELQTDYNKVGEENVEFEILDQLKPNDQVGFDYSEELELLEEMWLEKLQPFGEKGYNKPKKTAK